MAIGDFHLHSTASDGVYSPTWVLETAAANGVRSLALTDHDSTAGLAEAGAAAERLGLRLIPGVELSTDYGASDVHLLGFGIDVTHRPFQDFVEWQREGRIERTRTIVKILRDNGAPVEEKRVFEIAGDATVGRPHVARALVEAGHVTSVQDAFDRWLGNGKVADVQREKLDPADAIRQVHEAGGMVFIAHAIYIAEDYAPVIEQLREWGADGLETYYKHYLPETVDAHASLAARLGMATSGGSDFHGLGNPDDHAIGDIPFPDDEVERFLSFLESAGVDTGTRSVA